MGYPGLNWRQAKALAEKHIESFQKKLDAYDRGSRNVRPDECEHYIEIWQGVLQAATPEGWDSASLAADERDEIADALATGGYDELLAAHKPS